MATKLLAARSAAAWQLAREQYGILTRRDLVGLGFTSGAIRHRLATGRLHRIRDGVYAVGRLVRPQRSQAIISAGAGAAAAIDILSTLKGEPVQDWDEPPTQK